MCEDILDHWHDECKVCKDVLDDLNDHCPQPEPPAGLSKLGESLGSGTVMPPKKQERERAKQARALPVGASGLDFVEEVAQCVQRSVSTATQRSSATRPPHRPPSHAAWYRCKSLLQEANAGHSKHGTIAKMRVLPLLLKPVLSFHPPCLLLYAVTAEAAVHLALVAPATSGKGIRVQTLSTDAQSDGLRCKMLALLASYHAVPFPPSKGDLPPQVASLL